MQRLRVPLVRDEMDDAIEMIDHDKSGDISISELINWFRYEFDGLYKRSKNCGLLSKKETKWFINAQATQVVKKRWTLWSKAKPHIRE